MQILRTPDDRFVGLDGYPFAPHYVEVGDGDDGTLRVHYVDEGPRDAPPVLLLHGEPSWSYLYRHMIPPLAAAGHRVIAPDLVGFGRSDKPASQDDFTYARLVGWMSQALFDRLDLTDITLFCQDWGGLIGLRLVAQDPDRFARLVVANTGMPTGDQRMPDAFFAWQRFSRETEQFPVGHIVNGGTVRDLTDAEVAAYDAPFPDDSFKAGPKILPSLVPTSPDDPAADDNRRAWEVLGAFDGPVLTAFSDKDPVTSGGEAVFHKLVPGAAGQPHTTIVDAGHFLQEDAPQRLADLIDGFVRTA
jgi:haloalkane dehalogenase